MKKIPILCAGLMLSAVTTANAAMTFVDIDGSVVSAPVLIDSTKDAVYFSETVDGSGNGQYTVTNNTLSVVGEGYSLVSFGISNTNTSAWIENIGSTFGCGFDSSSNWCYGSSELDSSNWASTPLAYGGSGPVTGQDIFGDISNVLDAGDNMFNFYDAQDGDLFSGSSWDQFLYSPGIPASQLFVVLSGSNGPIFASGGQPINTVPVPAAVWLFGSGLLGLVGMARRRKMS